MNQGFLLCGCIIHTRIEPAVGPSPGTDTDRRSPGSPMNGGGCRGFPVVQKCAELSLLAVRVSGRLLLDVALTLYRAFAGFGIAAVVGVALGLLITRFVAVRWFFDPIVSFALPMPKIALMPVFMLWFGLFDMSKILMVAFSLSFQIIISTWSAAHGVEKELVWSARSLGASDRSTLWEVILPAALPQILTGLQVALPLALIVALVTEMIMGGGGLGDTMLQSARYVDSPGVFAGIVEIGIVGYGCIAAMALIRKRLLAWHQESGAGGAI